MATTTHTHSEREQAFFQKRVAIYGAVVGGCFGFFLVFRAAMLVLGGQTTQLLHPSMLYHLAATLGFFSAWVLCHKGVRTPRQARTIETFSLLSGMVGTALMGGHIPLDARPEYILLMALTYAVLARSIWVPSSTRRSLVLSLLIGTDLVVGTYMMYASKAGVRFAATSLLYDGQDISAHAVGTMQAVFTGAWWVLTAFIATATSHVIYGLRRAVRDAKRLGQYQLEAKLGQGGMGVVYRARHAMLQRPTAVKVMHAKFPSEAELQRFEHEVRQTARLSHPNVVTIFDFGKTAEGVFYYAMEYIDGVDLGEVVEEGGPVPAARVVHILERVCSALVEAHGYGLIHRDIKPENIMLHLPHTFGGVPEGVKLLDFGLVKEIAHKGPGWTDTEVVRGTPLYMAPESIRAPELVDARTDLYSVGAVGYYLLTGTHVFSGENLVEVCGHHLHSEPEPPSWRANRSIPAALEELILSCLEKDQGRRPPSALQLQELLRSCSTGPPWSAEQSLDWWQKWQHAHPMRSDAPPTGKTEIAIDLSRTHRPAETPQTW